MAESLSIVFIDWDDFFPSIDVFLSNWSAFYVQYSDDD